MQLRRAEVEGLLLLAPEERARREQRREQRTVAEDRTDLTLDLRDQHPPRPEGAVDQTGVVQPVHALADLGHDVEGIGRPEPRRSAELSEVEPSDRTEGEERLPADLAHLVQTWQVVRPEPAHGLGDGEHSGARLRVVDDVRHQQPEGPRLPRRDLDGVDQRTGAVVHGLGQQSVATELHVRPTVHHGRETSERNTPIARKRAVSPYEPCRPWRSSHTNAYAGSPACSSRRVSTHSPTSYAG